MFKRSSAICLSRLVKAVDIVISRRDDAFRSGLTLVEVVGGLVLLATLLVSILMAFNAHARQIKMAAARLEAIDLTDQLIAGWYQEGKLPEPGEEGKFPSQPTLFWRTVSVATDIEPVPAQVMRIDVIDASNFSKPETLTTVEILAPAAKERR